MTKTRNKMKITGLILTLVMTVSLLVIFSLTTSATLNTDAAGGCDGEHEGYTSLTEGTISEPGNYYLTADLTAETSEPVISIECQGTVTICLNGFDIYHTGNFYNAIGIEAVEGELTVNLCDCKGTGEISNKDGGGGIFFTGEDYHKTFNMYGGTIKDCTFGITTSENMTVNMYGGTITQCRYYAIFQHEDEGNGAAHVNIFGGSIVDNQEGIRVTGSDCVTLTGSPVMMYNYDGDIYFRLKATITVKELNVSDKITVQMEDYADGPIAVVDTPDALDSFESVYFEKYLVYYNGKIVFHGEEHQWVDATCVSPKLCELCGETEGEIDENAHRSDGGENCADCGEHAFVTINGETYAILGDITNTGIYFNHNESPAPGAWKAGDGYLVLIVKDSYYADVILYNATVDVREIEDAVAVDIIKDHLDYYVYGTNNIYGNNRRAFHNGTVGEDTITNFIIDEDAVLNIYGDSDFDHLVVTSGEMNVYGRDISGDVGMAMQVIKSLTVKEGATLTAVGGKSDMGITVGIWVRKETVVDGVLNAFTVNREETEEKAILTFIVNGDVVLNCDNFNVYADYPGYEIILSVPEGAGLTVPEGIKLDLDSYTGVEIDGELIVNGTLICTHQGGEANCTALAVCDICKQGYGEKAPHDFSMTALSMTSCEEPRYSVNYCAVCSVFDESSREELPPTGHEWEDATCTTPKTCIYCRKTEGKALGHEWVAPDVDWCQVQAGCTRCGATEGENVAAHTWIDATYDAPKTCAVCGMTDGEPLQQESESETETTESEIENGGNQGGNSPHGGTNKPQGGGQAQKPDNNETETNTETDFGSESDTPTESETKKPVADENKESAGIDNETQKSGCGSSIGLGVIAIVAVILLEMIIFKKKEE